MSDDRELTRWWEAVQAAAPTVGAASIALWRGGLPSLAPTAVHLATARGWLDASDVGAIERQATVALASRVAARRLLRRMIVAGHGGCSPADVRIDVHCARCGETTHGPPIIVSPELTCYRLSTAATRDSFLVALAAASIGVDLERPSLASELSMRIVREAVPGWAAVERACAPRARVIDVWTAFEALTKATGLGVSAPVSTIASALVTHRLLWLEDEPDLVSCVATADPEPVVAIVELQLATGREASQTGIWARSAPDPGLSAPR